MEARVIELVRNELDTLPLSRRKSVLEDLLAEVNERIERRKAKYT